MQYELNSFNWKLLEASNDVNFRAVNDVFYHNQWTECYVDIHNLYNCHILRNIPEISSDSQHVVIRDVELKKRRLYFVMKCYVAGKIVINIKIDDFNVLQKQLIVSFNPASALFSEMIVNEINLVDSTTAKFTYRLFIFDVFGQEVPTNSDAICQVDAYYGGSRLKLRKVQNNEIHQCCYDITVEGNRPWSDDFNVRLNGKYVSLTKIYKFDGQECTSFAELSDEDQEEAEKVFPTDNIEELHIPLTTGEDDGCYLSYDQDDCELQTGNGNEHSLVCRNVTRAMIVASDFVYINNLKRVLNLTQRIKVKKTSNGVIIALPNIKSQLLKTSKDVVQHLLRGFYYRRKAFEASNIRLIWKDRLATIKEVLLLKSDSSSLILCQYFKDFFGELMNRYNEKARDELFKFFNFHRKKNEIDLHGLLVTDEDKLELLRLNLMISFSVPKNERASMRRKFRKQIISKESIERSYKGKHKTGSRSRDIVDKIVRDCQEKGDEAIHMLKRKMGLGTSFNENYIEKTNTPWLEIIVGAGRHGRIKNKQNIRPKVEEFLKDEDLEFHPVNKGSLIVTFQQYCGPEPCVGEYYCANCDRSWKSRKSFVGKYQRCMNCKKECWPVKQREKNKHDSYTREGRKRNPRRLNNRHESSLCQQCLELGHPCNIAY